MIVRCGDCRHPIELSDNDQFRELSCPNCSSSIDLVGADTTVSYTPSATETIGHFTLCEQLGAGAFGIVWKARDTSLDRTVAIKIPRRGRLTPAESEQFFREARAAAQLRHPNIVSLHEVGRDGETIYIVSDFIDGVTLTDHLAIRRPDFREAAELCCKLADALQHAHERGVIHRDLKPGNVMLDRYGEPYVMDFGLAKREAGEITMTMDGQILGTPAYMSPEQARGESHEVDRRADIFSMGVILFELLTGERPFRGSARMLLHQLLTEDAPSPRSLNANVPRDLETICLKCLRREPDRRYATARELSDDLSCWLDGRPIRARPVRRPERVWLWFRRHPTVTLAISLTLLAIVFSGWFSMRVRRGARIRELSTVVSSLNSTRGIILPPLERLNEFPRQATLSELQNQLQQAEGTRATALMCALAYLGDRRIDSLISLVRKSGAYEFDNLLEAMAGARDEAAVAVAAAAATAEQKSDWRTQARLAMLALRLGDAQPAATLCELRPDPIRRLIFIEECAQWHGDPEGLVVAIQDLDARMTHLRSAVALVLGSMPFEELTPAARSAGAKLLADWHANDPDGGLHSASGWALRNWGLPLPAIAPTANPPEKMRWHVNRLGMTMVEIPAGTFVRKDTRGGSIDQSVTITRSFLLATHEVTVAEFRTFLAGTDTTAADIPGNWKGLNSYTPGEQHPAGTLSWYAAVQFCNWLSRREGLRPCYTKSGAQETDLNGKSYDAWQLDLNSDGYRLPTEAEWDYASRSGAATALSYGEELSLIGRYAVFGSAHTEVPGSRMPSGWGLFDMLGNIAEWCHDWHAPYSMDTEIRDPLGPPDGKSRVTCGSAYYNLPHPTALATRTSVPPSFESTIGFRVARSQPEASRIPGQSSQSE